MPDARDVNPGPHGFSEVLYAVTSAANNNGSAFAGLGAATPFWNLLLAFCMLLGRFAVIVPVMAIAGSLVSKRSADQFRHSGHPRCAVYRSADRYRAAGWR